MSGVVAKQFSKLDRGLIAILRGIKPDETAGIVETLLKAGFEAIEIPLNSPDPFSSIRIAADVTGDRALIGAGTVLTEEDVDRLRDAGGNLMVTPNTVPNVISKAVGLGMVVMPGVFTASEALAAVAAGARGLKFFPASVLGAEGIAAIRAVLPPEVVIGAVGGVGPGNFSEYISAGITTFGLGSSLYKPGLAAEDIAIRAKTCIEAYDAALAQG